MSRLRAWGPSMSATAFIYQKPIPLRERASLARSALTPGRVLEIVGLPRGVPSNALLITWQRVHWRPDKQRLSIQRIAGPGKLQLSVPRECAGWVVRALVAPLLSDGTIGYIGAVRTHPRVHPRPCSWGKRTRVIRERLRVSIPYP